MIERPWNYAQVERNCVQCGNLFTCSPSRKTQHCGDACARKTQQAKMLKPIVQSICKACGQEFSQKQSTHMRVTCDSTCSGLFRRGIPPPNKLPLKIATCKQCGVVFQFPGSTISRIFCSTSCHDDSQLGQKPWNAVLKIIKVCLECCTEFSVIKAREESALYCSRDCAHTGKTHVIGANHPLFIEKDIRVCEQCGEDFEARAASDRRFCSRQCVGSYTTQLQGGRRSSLELLVEAELLRIGQPFEASKPLGPWLLDFFLPDKQMALECDGAYWHSIPEVAERDLRKDTWLQQRGYQITRIDEMDIRDDVVAAVHNALNFDCRCTEGIAS